MASPACTEQSSCNTNRVFDFTQTRSVIDTVLIEDRTNRTNRTTGLFNIRMPRGSGDMSDLFDTLDPSTPTTASFLSIEDPMPSYDHEFSTVTQDNVDTMARLRAPVSPRREIVESDNEAMEVYPTSTSDTCTQLPPSYLNMREPLSPVSSDAGSTDTSLSGFSDLEVGPPSPGIKMVPMTDCNTAPRSPRVIARRTRRRRVTEGGSCPHLWQFILELLGDRTNAPVLCWTGIDYQFKVNNSKEFARLWGAKKNKPRMNFDKLSRAMRYYYDKNILKHISGQRLVYEFLSNKEDTVYTRLLNDAAQSIPSRPSIQKSPYTPASTFSSPSLSNYLTPASSDAGSFGSTGLFQTPSEFAGMLPITAGHPAPFDPSMDQYMRMGEPDHYISSQELVDQLGDHVLLSFDLPIGEHRFAAAHGYSGVSPSYCARDTAQEKREVGKPYSTHAPY